MGHIQSSDLFKIEDARPLLKRIPNNRKQEYKEKMPEQGVTSKKLDTVSYGALKNLLVEQQRVVQQYQNNLEINPEKQVAGGIRYYGTFMNNLYDGRGQLICENSNSVYFGQFKQGEKHGRGTIIEQERQQKYVGGWRLGFKEGCGTIYYCSNAKCYPKRRIADVEARKGSTLTTNHKISVATDEFGLSLMIQLIRVLSLAMLIYISSQHEMQNRSGHIALSALIFALTTIIGIYQGIAAPTMQYLDNILTHQEFTKMIEDTQKKNFSVKLDIQKWRMEKRHKNGKQHCTRVVVGSANKQLKFEQAVDFTTNLEDFQSLGWYDVNATKPVDYVFVTVEINMYFTEHARQSFEHQMIDLLGSQQLEKHGAQNTFSLKQEFYTGNRYNFAVCRNNEIVQRLRFGRVMQMILSVFGLAVYHEMMLRMGRQMMKYSINKYVIK